MPKLSSLITLTQYDKKFNLPTLYPAKNVLNTLGEIIANTDKCQLRIAETEKYAHVTYFFNGGRETPWPNEDRILVPSPKVKTYDSRPAMSAIEITDKIIQSLPKYEFIVCNYANADMVGHTGNMSATRLAIECIDNCLGRLVAEMKKYDGTILITSDHGNAELMYDPKTNQPHTAHTDNLVPLLYIGKPVITHHLNGNLIDIAPTILSLMNLDCPKEMTGQPIFTNPKP